MTRKTRKIIFYVFVAVFVLLSASVVLYAQGWRLDIATGRVEKTGAVYVRSFPADARIALNGKPIQNQAGFFSRGTLVGDLFPQTYNLSLTEPGYIEWHENAPVLPSLVTEFNYAVLVPQAPAAVGTTSIKNFFAASGETILQTEANAIISRGKTIGHGTLTSESLDVNDIIFKSSATGDYLRYDLSEGTSTNLSAILTENGIATKNISSLAIDPYDATKIVGESGARIWIMDIATANLSFIENAPAGTISAAPPATSPSFIAWMQIREQFSNLNDISLQPIHANRCHKFHILPWRPSRTCMDRQQQLWYPRERRIALCVQHKCEPAPKVGRRC